MIIVNDELERTWTDAAVTYSVSPIHLSGQPVCGGEESKRGPLEYGLQTFYNDISFQVKRRKPCKYFMLTEARFILYNIRSFGKDKLQQATFIEMENTT